MATSMLLRTCRTAGTRGRRCLSVISEYPSISEELRDRFTPTHPTLKMREQDNNGNGVDREADLPAIMRPNLAFADADAGPLGPKVYNFAVGEKPVVLGCADLASPPDSWTAAKNFEFEFDGFSDFRLRLAESNGQGPTDKGPLAIAAE